MGARSGARLIELDALLHSPLGWAVAAVVVFAALAHGTVGFGFPVISTPVVAMMTDLRTAIMVTLFPNIVINVLSVLRGGNWRQSLGKYWLMALYVLIGTVIGTHVLVSVDAEPLKLLLAAMLAVYLLQGRLGQFAAEWVKRYPQRSALIVGLCAGFLAGTVNVTVPPLVMYFMALGVTSVAMTQVLNLCFLVGKSTQAVTLGVSGKIGLATLIATTPLTVLAVVMLYVGMRLQDRIAPEAYNVLLRKLLWAMAVMLVLQVGWHYARAAIAPSGG